ncbi:MAG TPA: adenosylmethionine--8-amino-7-oxononanoate transaminase [Nitratifractor sp.]|nr:adenosylmethionine--8-amino-7-oxononanoate transaminase [Nitratifractor sp.]
MKDYEQNLPLIPIARGSGAYLYDFDDNRYLDAISSWWVNLFGHANSTINQKLKAQLDTLEHVIFAGFTHEPAIKLASRLVEISPEGLNKVFFADNGSSAIEIALKMSFQYYKNQGEVRPYFISLENSYHGETMGALAVGDVSLYKEIYNEILIESLQAKSPALCSESEALADMERLLKEHKSKVSAVVIEPLVQCAGSMAMYDASYIRQLKALCEEYGVHLIADEIAVGFGRTGTMFACEQAGISPDFLCLSKGITGGYLPLSTVLITDDIYNAFYCDYESGKSFLDSHSYTGNTLACAAANATLDIFEEERIIEKNRATIELVSKELATLKGLPHIADIRQRGMIAAIELENPDPKRRINLEVYRYALSQGLLLRPLGNVIYIMPPYIITKEQIELIFSVIRGAIKRL